MVLIFFTIFDPLIWNFRPPGFIFKVPAQGAAQPGCKVVLRDIAEFGTGPGLIDRVAAVVALAIRNECLEVTRGAAPRCRGLRVAVGKAVDLGKGAVDFSADAVDDGHVGQLLAAADVVGLARLAILQRRLDTAAMVLDVEPVPHVHAIAVDRQRLARKRVEDEQRDEFFRVMVRPVVVGTIGRRRIQPVGVMPGTHQVIGSSLGR